MENKKIVVTEKCEIEIPEAKMLIQFDGKKVQLSFLTDTDLMVDGDFRIGTTGNFEVISKGNVFLDTVEEESSINLNCRNKKEQKKLIEDK